MSLEIDNLGTFSQHTYNELYSKYVKKSKELVNNLVRESVDTFNESLQTYPTIVNDAIKDDIFEINKSFNDLLIDEQLLKIYPGSPHYNFIKTTAGNKPSVQDVFVDVNKCQDGINGLYRKFKEVYQASNSTLDIKAKKNLLDMIIIDYASYLDYSREVGNILIVIENDLYSIYDESKGFRSTDRPYTGSLTNAAKTLEESSFEFMSKVNEIKLGMLKAIKTTELQDYSVGLEGAIGQYFDDYISNNGYKLNKPKELANNIIANLYKVDKLYDQVYETSTDVDSLTIILDDITFDLKNLSDDLLKKSISIQNPNEYVDDIIRISKQNYEKSGEADFSVLDAESTYLTDTEFYNEAQERYFIDSLFDCGLIDSSVNRTSVNESNFYEYIDFENFDIAEMDYYFEVYSDNPDVIAGLYFGVSDLISTEELPPSEVEILIMIQAACYFVLGTDNVYDRSTYNTRDISKVEITNDGISVFYTEQYHTKDARSYGETTPLSMQFLTATNDDTANEILRKSATNSSERIRQAISDIRTEYYERNENALRDYILGFADVGKVGIIIRTGKLAEDLVELNSEYKAYSNELARALILSEAQTLLLNEIDYIDNIDMEFGVYAFLDNGPEGTNILRLKYYETNETRVYMQAIDNAYIISQGEGTPGYEEAMRASYKLVEHKTQDNYNQFKGSYARNMEIYSDEFKELKDMNLHDIVEKYEQYRAPIEIIGHLLML